MPDIDYHLRNQVSTALRALDNLDRSISLVSSQVTAVRDEQTQTRSDLAQLRAEFIEFVRRAEFTANLQRAETKRGAIQGQLEFEFGHYKLVRRSAVGTLQAFDKGLLSEETLRMIGEELMIQSPRYWLAPVLVALGAWAGNEQDLCRRAVEVAYERSPSRTCLFMALVLRRQGRRTSAVRWLKHYLDAQDPTALGRDFAVILESISQGAFGPAGLELVQTYLDRWRDLLITDEVTTEAQVQRWRAELDSHVSTVGLAARYPRLSKVSPQWPRLSQCLAAAESQQGVLDAYEAMFAEEYEPTDRLEDAVDDILDRLVEEYDPEELPLRRELAFNEAVIKHAGDVDAAKKELAANAAAMESTLDYLTIQTTSALRPETIGLSRPTQRLAVAACHTWFARAHALFAKDYRAAVPANVEAAFESTHNAAATAFQLPRWVGSFTQPIEQLERSLAEHWDRHTARFLASLAFQNTKWLGPGVVAIIGILIMFGSPVVGLLALVAAGIWAISVNNKRLAARQRQDQARSSLGQAKHDSIQQLRAARAELTDWYAQFQAADAVEAKLRALIEELPTKANAPLPFEGRTVTQYSPPAQYAPPPADITTTSYDAPAPADVAPASPYPGWPAADGSGLTNDNPGSQE